MSEHGTPRGTLLEAPRADADQALAPRLPDREPAALPNLPNLRSFPPPPIARPPRPARPRARGWQLAVGVAVAVAMVAFAAGAVGVFIGRQLVVREPAPPGTPSRQAIDVADRRESMPRIDVAAVSGAVGPSVVTISADLGSGDGAGESIGTGIITTSDGEIVTNAHVVAGASKIRVRLLGETEPREARLLAADVGNDLALLRVAGTGYPAARFAAPESIGVGDEVVAIGFALDLDGQPSVTLGIVSALDRTVMTEHGALNGLVQTDAAISSGNSGGPLVNAAGEIVGINTAIVRGGQTAAATNIGMAISNGEALPVIASLREHSTGNARVEGYMGLGLEDRIDGGGGAVVTIVESEAPAGIAGLEAGDIVIEVDGTAVEGAAGLIAAVRDRQPGDQLMLVVLRGGDSHTLDIVLATRPDG
ncbi:MAG: S1C family serine protease [Ilumatobacteraceae bacterium]